MNWGHGITALVLSFMAFMIFMVVQCVRQDFYLVSENYYEEGVSYDERQNSEKNVTALAKDVSIQQGVTHLALSIPTEVSKGNITFYRPDNGNSDFDLPLNPGETMYEVTTAEMEAGKWLVKSTWSDGNKDYYSEQSIFVQ